MKDINEMPRDTLSEKSLLGCLIVDGSVFDEVSDLDLAKEDFFHPQYGIIFEAINDLFNSRQPIDYVTLSSKLNDKGKLEAIGGEKAILEIVEDHASTANAYHYAKIVKDKSSLRNIVKTAQVVAEKGKSFEGNPQEFIQEVEASFFKLTNQAKNKNLIKLNAALKQNLIDLEDTSRSPGEISGLPTGFKELDKMLLGMQPGQLIILAARPAMGKTSLAMNIVINSVEQSQLPVAFFSLEMISQELSMRLLSGKAKVDSRKLRTKDFLDTDLRNISMAVQELSHLPIYINDSGVSLNEIQSQCRKIKTDEGLGLVVIDYLQLMKANTTIASREQQISEISRGLKQMAKELACPVLCLSQLNRGVETRPGNKRPNVSDLRESGAIEQDADIVMMIYRDEVYNPDTKDKGVAEIIVGKNRGGEIGTAKVSWVGKYTSFENLTYKPDII
jgi:replicative DNA helicase